MSLRSLLFLSYLSSVFATQYSSYDVWDSAPDLPLQYIGDLCPAHPFAFQTKMCLAPYDLFVYDTRDHEPWTTQPQCLTSPSEYSTEPETYCIYSKKDFAGGRGITIVATPEVADEITNLPAFTDPSRVAGFNDESNAPFKRAMVPGRGWGIVANRTIFRGERIMTETSAWIYDRNAFTKLETERRVPFHWHAAQLLPEETRAQFLGLHRQDEDDELDSIMKTNAFGTYFGEWVLHNNVFPRLSRFNHDCRPNAHYYFDKDTMTQYVNAVRKIEEDEEILINYTEPEATSSVRKDAIMTSWGFECQCSLCRQTPDALLTSDHRLEQIAGIKAQLQDWSDPRLDRIKLAELLISLYKLERLDIPLAYGYESAAYAHSVQGNEYETMKYAAKAAESMAIYYGPQHPMTIDMLSLSTHPKNHRTWKYVHPNKAKAKGEPTESRTSKKWSFL